MVCSNPVQMELFRGLLAVGVFVILGVMILIRPVCPTHLVKRIECRDKHQKS